MDKQDNPITKNHFVWIGSPVVGVLSEVPAVKLEVSTYTVNGEKCVAVKDTQATPSMVLKVGANFSNVPFNTLATLLFPAYSISSSGIGMVISTDNPVVSVILFIPVESYKLISIGKYFIFSNVLVSPRSACSIAACASALSVILTTKLSVEPFTFADAILVFEIPGLVIEITVPVVFDAAFVHVSDDKTYKNFCNLIEAILAYHKAYGGE